MVRLLVCLGLVLLPLTSVAVCTDQQLTTEFQTDPAGLNYATPISRGNDQSVYRLFTQVRSGAAYQQQRGVLAAADIVAAFDPTEYAALPVLGLQQVTTLLTVQSLDFRIANIMTMLQAPFPAGGPTRTNLQTLAVRQGSRAEVVCGPVPPNPPITLEDVSRALTPLRPGG